MYGFDAFGVTPFAGLPDIINKFSNLLTIGQNVQVIVASNIFQTLNLTQANTCVVGVINSIPITNTLTLTQMVNVSTPSNPAQTLLILQSHSVEHDNVINAAQSIVIGQSVNFNSDHVINVSHALSIVQVVQPTQVIANSQTLTLVQLLAADAWKNTLQPLTIGQTVAYNASYVVNISHGLSINSVPVIDTPTGITHNLVIIHSVNAIVPNSFGTTHSISIVQGLAVAQTTIVPQTLAIVQTLGFTRSNNLGITHVIPINQANSISYPPGNIAHTLTFVQAVVCITPSPVNASNTLTFSQNVKVGSGTVVIQPLNIQQSYTYAHNVPGPFTHSLTFVQIPQFNRSISLSHALTIVQTIVARIPINVSVSQTLTLTDTPKYGYGVFQADSLTITQDVVVVHANTVSVADRLTFSQVGEEGATSNLKQLLAITQKVQVSLGVSVTHALTITQGVQYSTVLHVAHTLTLTNSNNAVTVYHTPIQHPLNLVQVNNPSTDYNLFNYDTISLKDVGQLNYSNYLLVCQCINILQNLTNAIPIAVSQHLTFTWNELDVQYQKLNLVQLVETNFDDFDCCSPNGNNGDRDSSVVLSVTQLVNCVTNYNVNVTQGLSLLSSMTWRP